MVFCSFYAWNMVRCADNVPVCDIKTQRRLIMETNNEFIGKMTHSELKMILKVLEAEVEKREEDIRGLKKLVDAVRGALIDKGGRTP